MAFVVALGLAMLTATPAFATGNEPPSPPALPVTAESLHAKLRAIYPHNKLHDPEAQRKELELHPEFEINLFAASPWVVNPIAMSWDAAGRLWVINSPCYPQILPGMEPLDFISVLEDTNGDGRADRCTIFYDKLYVPTGIEHGQHGVYVANQPDLLFLEDRNGDLRADRTTVLLSGFGTEDNHHAISAFTWAPGGRLHFQSGVFLHTQVETPHGVVRLDDGGVFEFHPRTMRLGLFNVGTATNPWGHAFDRWGQSFLTEGPQGGIWYLTPGTVSSRPSERVPGTSAPKSCGNRFIESAHFSDEWQGKMVLNAFKNKTVNLYEFSDDGAGYATRELQPHLVVSKEPYFRPVDVQLGPDGALYVADFFQEIIGHMQYEFRDPRRDHLNGRIWRITQKGRAPLPRRNLNELADTELAANLKSPNAHERHRSRQLLGDRDQRRSLAALAAFRQKLDPRAPQFEHHRLESLWTYQTLDHVEPALLRQVLDSPEPRARAAAVRVLRDWRNGLPDAFALLERKAADEHPRVRLEALCALSDFAEPRAMEAAARVVDRPMDRYLEYAFRHTARALREQWLPALREGRIDFDGRPERLRAALAAVDAPAAVPMLLGLLDAGKVPVERREGVLALVARLGEPPQLRRLFERDRLAELLAKADGGAYDAGTHARLLDILADTARDRGTKPDGANRAEELGRLLTAEDSRLRAAALRLASAWKEDAVRVEIAAAANETTASPAVRESAVEALSSLGDAESRATLVRIAGGDAPLSLRFRAVEGLAAIDVGQAADLATRLLALAPGEARPGDMLAAFASRKGGSDALLESLEKRPPHRDMARLALRHLHQTGTAPAALVERFERLVGAGTLSQQLAAVGSTALIAEIERNGDPTRGESVFRRANLACIACHAVSGGGPHVGPDLEGIGVSSPRDYIVESVLDPDQAIREGYAAVTILTTAGRLHTGILRGMSPGGAELLDPQTRSIRRIAQEEIEETIPAKSIMPRGLVDKMTRQEFVDLARFLMELGRPGPYAPANLPAIRTWRVLSDVPEEWSRLPDDDFARRVGEVDETLRATAHADRGWQPMYSRVSGTLPLDEITREGLVVVRAEIEVGTAGRIALAFDDPAGVRLWADDRSVAVVERTEFEMPQGTQRLLFAVDRSRRKSPGLRVVIEEAPDSPARARPVNGM